jgi:hypothetical protein
LSVCDAWEKHDEKPRDRTSQSFVHARSAINNWANDESSETGAVCIHLALSSTPCDLSADTSRSFLQRKQAAMNLGFRAPEGTTTIP